RAGAEEKIRFAHLRFPNADDRRRDVVFLDRQSLSEQPPGKGSSATASYFRKSRRSQSAGIAQGARRRRVSRQAFCHQSVTRKNPSDCSGDRVGALIALEISADRFRRGVVAWLPANQ